MLSSPSPVAWSPFAFFMLSSSMLLSSALCCSSFFYHKRVRRTDGLPWACQALCLLLWQVCEYCRISLWLFVESRWPLSSPRHRIPKRGSRYLAQGGCYSGWMCCQCCHHLWRKDKVRFFHLKFEIIASVTEAATYLNFLPRLSKWASVYIESVLRLWLAWRGDFSTYTLT